MNYSDFLLFPTNCITLKKYNENAKMLKKVKYFLHIRYTLKTYKKNP